MEKLHYHVNQLILMYIQKHLKSTMMLAFSPAHKQFAVLFTYITKRIRMEKNSKKQ